MLRTHKKHGFARAAQHMQDTFRDAEQPIIDSARHTKDSLKHSADCARDSALHSGRYAKQAVKDHPGFTIAGMAMLLVGAIFGLVLAQFLPSFVRSSRMRRM